MKPNHVKLAFETEAILVPLECLIPTKVLPKTLVKQEKYQQVVASIKEVGIIEPVMVFPEKKRARSVVDVTVGQTTYIILDGHLRVFALKELGKIAAPCLIATDDEAFTYNYHVNRLSTIQEHFMILKALDGGVSEERLARTLKVDIAKIREKRDLLKGICPEAIELLKTKVIATHALKFLRQVKPMRQIEMAELMIASANYTDPYARALYLASPQNQLLDHDKEKAAAGVSPADMARMEKEMETLGRDFKLLEDSYGRNFLSLVMTRNYLVRLLDNARIVRFLSQHQPDLLSEFQKIIEMSSLEG